MKTHCFNLPLGTAYPIMGLFPQKVQRTHAKSDRKVGGHQIRISGNCSGSGSEHQEQALLNCVQTWEIEAEKVQSLKK
jgi:hypothetical protein